MQKKKYILGIESSCDETSVAIVTRNNKDNKPKVLANIVKNQIHVHESFGGVVPELAARAHSDVIDLLVEKALKKAKIKLKDITAVAFDRSGFLYHGRVKALAESARENGLDF